MSTETSNIIPIPEEFKKVIVDFISDILTTFPEYAPIINKWWTTDKFSDLPEQAQNEKMEFIFNYCLKHFPERFMDIIYQNVNIFSDVSNTNTDFLPGINFKYLWSCDISAKTSETIWKYLQLLLLSLIGSLKDKTVFGDTAKLLESINETEFKEKLQDTLEKLQSIFEKPDVTTNENENGNGNENGNENKDKPKINMDDFPNVDNIQNHISGMLGGKLGELAKEIAEETAGNLNMDFENATNVSDIMQGLFKNPGKLMELVKNVGEKLDSRIKNGDIKENELYSEATEIMNRMKDMPGMDNIQNLMQKMGMGMGDMANLGNLANMMGGKNAKVDTNAMKMKLERMDKNAKMKERLNQRNLQKMAQQLAVTNTQTGAQPSSSQSVMSDNELIEFIESTTNSGAAKLLSEKSKNGKKNKK